MPKGKRKLVIKRDENNSLPRVTRLLSRRLLMSQNNHEVPVASKMEINLTSATLTGQSEEELTPNLTQLKAEPISNYCDKTEDIPLTMRIKADDLTRTVTKTSDGLSSETENTQQRLNITLKPTEIINNNSDCNTEITPLTTQVETDAMKISKPKLVCKVKVPAEIIELETTVVDDYPICDTDSISQIVKPEENLESRNNLLQENVDNLELIEVDNNSECLMKDMEVETKLTSNILYPKIESTTLISNIIMEAKKVTIDENPTCKSIIKSSEVCRQMDSVFDTINKAEDVADEPEVFSQAQLMNSESETRDTSSTTQVQIGSITDAKELEENFTRRVLEEQLTPEKSKAEEIGDNTSAEKLEIYSISKVVELKTNQLLKFGEPAPCQVDVKSEAIKISHHPGPVMTESPSTALMEFTYPLPNQSKYERKSKDLNPTEVIVEPAACGSNDTCLVTKVQTNSLTEPLKEQVLENLSKLEPITGIVNPECRSNDVILVTRIQSDLKSEKPKRKRVRKAPAKVTEKLIESESTERNINSEYKSDDKLLSTEVQTGLILQTDVKSEKPKRKRVRKTPARVTENSCLIEVGSMERNIDPESKSDDKLLPTEVRNDVESEKPKRKRIRKSRAEVPEKLMEIESTDRNINPECKSDDKPLPTEVQTVESEKPKRKRVRKSRAKVPEKLMEIESTDRNINPKCESDDKLLLTDVQTDLILKTLKPKIKRVRKSRAKVSEKILPLENVEINNNPTSKTEDKIVGYCSALLPLETLKLIDNSKSVTEETVPNAKSETSLVIIEPAKTNIEDVDEEKNVLLQNRSPANLFSEIVENKYLLLKEEYQPKVLVENIFGSNKLSLEQTEMISEKIKSQGRTSLKNLPDSSIQKKIIKTSPEIAKSNTESINTEKSSSKKAGIRKQKTVKSDISIVTKRRRTSKKKLIESSKLDSSTQDNDFKIDSTASISPLLTSPVTSFEVPLDLSIKSLTSGESVAANPVDTFLGESCSGTGMHDKGFGSSIFKVTDRSTSFQLIKTINVHNHETMDNDFKGETITFYKAPGDSPEEVSQSTETASTQVIQQARSETTITTDQLSIRVSIPAEYFFGSNSYATGEKLDKVIEQEKTVLTKAQTKLYTDCEFNETEHLLCKDTTNKISDQEPSQINSFVEVSKKSTKGSNSKWDEWTTSDASDNDSPKTTKNYDADVRVIEVSEPNSSECIRKPIITNIRSLPKIIADEFLPKGTIHFAAGSCKSETAIDTVEISQQLDSTITNVSNEDQENCEIQIQEQSTDQRTDIGDKDNLDKSKIMEKLLSLSNSATCQHNMNSENISDYIGTQIGDQCSPVEMNFDSTHLWQICPELATFLGQEDDVVNNNDKNPTNIDTLNTDDTNGDDTNSLHGLTTKMEIPPTVKDAKELSSNDVTDAAEHTENFCNNMGKGVVAVKPNYEEMDAEPIGIENESDQAKSSVLVDLTTDNLRNFNNLSNRKAEGGLNWSVETCEYYRLHEDAVKPSDKSLPCVAVENDYKCKKSVAESSNKEIFDTECKKRKRKWVQDEKDIKPIKDKRLRLNRTRWSIDGQDCDNATRYRKQTSYQSNSSVNSFTAKLLQSTLSPKKTRDVESNSTREIREPDHSEYNCETTELDQKIVDSTEKHQKKNDPTSTTNSASTFKQLISDASKYAFETIQNDDTSSRFDQNGNLTSSSSSSNSSSSHSRISNPEATTEPNQTKFEKTEENEEELDADYISLYAESEFANIDHETNLMRAFSMSTLFEVKEESDDKFQDMNDVGTFLEKNLQECAEAFDSCVNEDKSMRNTSENILQNSFNRNHDTISSLQKNINQSNLNNQSCTEVHSPANIVQRPILDKDNLRPNVRAPYVSSFHVESLFRRNCHLQLRKGICQRHECYYSHQLAPQLYNLHREDPNIINDVFDFAIYNGYHYFVVFKYRALIMQSDYFSAIKLFFKLADAHLMTENLVMCTFSAINRFGITLTQFVMDIASLFDENDEEIAQCVLRSLNKNIETGFYWQTFRSLILRITPSDPDLNRIIYECVHCNKDRSHIEDVYVNYVQKLTEAQLSSININLYRKFDYILTKYNLIHPTEVSNPIPIALENVDRTLLEINTINRYAVGIPTILSPDDAAHYNTDNLSHPSAGSKQASLRSVKWEPNGVQIHNQNIAATEINSKQNFVDQKNVVATQVSSPAKELSMHSNHIEMSNQNAVKSSTGTWKLHPIDNLEPPRSVYHDRHWMRHLAMHNLKVALNHKQYPLALIILDRFSNREISDDKKLYMSSCYNMLRLEVMESATHVRNMIKLSVLAGLNNSLNETLFNLGFYVMVELCNTNEWVRAYSLFKSLKKSPAILVENNAAFYLKSAEVCLANRRTLKAFNILKQKKMLCENRCRWDVVSNPNDEHVRILIINRSMDVLCQKYPDEAYYLFTYILRDQARIYHPVDLTAHVDNLVSSILNSKCNVLVTELARLITNHNFALKNSVFQSLIVKTFHQDLTLCRQVHCYGTWIGIYPTVKLTLPLHMLVKTNWKEEEMYLVAIDFIEKLSMDIGSAVDSIGPNQFTIHVVFELEPFKEQETLNNNVKVCNKDELKISKEIMKKVLREKFDPPIRTIISERERFIKLQSRSVVDYLKSMTG